MVIHSVILSIHSIQKLFASLNANVAVERRIVLDIFKTVPQIVTKRIYVAQQKA